MIPQRMTTHDARSVKVPFVIVGSLTLAAVGVWEIVSPWVIGYTSWTFGHWNDVACGILAVLLGLASAVIGRRSAEGLWPTVRSASPSIAIAGLGVYLTVMVFARYYQHIGRVEAFYVLCVAMTYIILGLAVAATSLALERRPMTPGGEQVVRDAHLSPVG
jgi:hypothetical protein